VTTEIGLYSPACHTFQVPLTRVFAAGVPETGAVQEVLFWQTCTVRMMYRIIGAALKEVGSENQPLDYLAFYCIGLFLSSCSSGYVANAGRQIL
jgi:hypothetical protein